MLVVTGTDCMSSCKSNYHAITPMMAHKEVFRQRPNICQIQEVEFC
jgi:hypothetical protein